VVAEAGGEDNKVEEGNSEASKTSPVAEDGVEEEDEAEQFPLSRPAILC
jgi:hypothetical protein